MSRGRVGAAGILGTLAALLAAAPVPAQEGHLLVVGGLGGTPELDERFGQAGSLLVDAARERFGLPEENVVYLAPEPESDGERIDGRSTAEEVERALSGLADRAEPGDRVMIVLLGHGSWDGETARISLPGPDLTAADFAELLSPFDEQTVAFVNTTSSSGPFLRALSGERRIVVTATSRGGERNATLFGRFFAEAMASSGADLDQDGSVSLLEAFTHAKAAVDGHYEENNLLQTEHPRLDDDGDGEGAADPGPDADDGTLAASFVLAPGPAVAGAPPELQELYDQRRILEEDLRDLRARSEEMDADRYDDSLEVLLLDLARTNQEIRDLERESDGELER